MVGCHMFSANSSVAFELEVENISKADIYPTIISNSSNERFGVVSIGKSKTVGFSPFKLGDKVQISWEEGESYELSYVTIDSSKIVKVKNKVTSVHLIYYGNKKWVLKAFDKNDKEIGSVP